MALKEIFRRKSAELDVEDIRFVGEQDGAAEQRLKQKLAEIFRPDQRQRGLSCASGHERRRTVVLGLHTEGEDDSRLVDQINSTFASIFNASQHLDALFLSEEHAAVGRVCRSLFDR
jgi:hypothetical protein